MESIERTPAHLSLGRKISAAAAGLSGTYEDGFSYNVYDDLENKFQGTDLRGGVIFRTPLKLVNHHSSCSRCFYALEIDTYGRGCTFNCAYCYAKEQLTKHGFWNRPHPFPIDIAQVRKLFWTVFETSKRSRWRSILEKRIPLRIGSMSDSFMWVDRKYRVTLELLKILKHYCYPYIIFTRSDLIAQEEYLSAIDTQLASVQFSICGANEGLTKLLEPGAPSVARRIQAIRALSGAGVWTGVRINPLFPKYPDGYFTDPEWTRKRFAEGGAVPTFELFDIDRIEDFVSVLTNAGTKTVVTGFVRLSVNALSSMRKKLGVDLSMFFRSEKSRDRRYSDVEIAHYYAKIRSVCQSHGLRFSTCYIGNGEKDFFQYQDLWSNPRDCCDTKGNVSSFKTTCESISWQERLRHAPVRRASVDGSARPPSTIGAGSPGAKSFENSPGC